MVEILGFAFQSVANIVGKVESTGCHSFLLFQNKLEKKIPAVFKTHNCFEKGLSYFMQINKREYSVKN